MMDLAIMSESEVQWVDRYHETVRAVVSPRLQHDAATLAWLQQSTRPLIQLK